MYKPPIEMIIHRQLPQIVRETEAAVMKAVCEVGITVDKDELVKALEYDRDQYTKGYEDGKKAVIEWLKEIGVTVYKEDW